jgi:hypothetical protein
MFATPHVYVGGFASNKRNLFISSCTNVGVALLSGTPEEDAKTRKQKKAANVGSFNVLRVKSTNCGVQFVISCTNMYCIKC